MSVSRGTAISPEPKPAMPRTQYARKTTSPEETAVSRLTGTGRRSGARATLEMPGALIAVPEAEHVASLPRARVHEGGPTVRELAVVQVLELALLDPELAQAGGIVHDLPHGLERPGALVVELHARELGTVAHVVLVVA